MSSDHFPIQISLDKPLKRNTPLTEPRYRFDKTNDDSLHNTLKDSLTNIDTNIITQDELEELAVTLCDKLMKAVDTSTPKVYSRNDPKSPISQAILDLIKEKRRLRRLYNNTQDPNTKSTINRLQKEIRTKINQESTISWEKFCNSISLESDPKKSWRKITNFLNRKTHPRSYPTLKLGNKTAKTSPEKAQLFAESVERNFGIESHLFSKSQFDRINKFVEAHSYHFTPLDSLHDNITDTDDDSDLVADVDPDTLIRIVRTELKNGDKLMKAVDTSTPKVYSRNDPKSPISQAILDLIKEKRRLRRLYNNTQDPNTKSTINRLQKEIRTKINQESTISWEKFCNSISLESDPKKSWRKITNFLNRKTHPRSYPMLKLGNKTAKTSPEKAQLFAESVERNFGIESHLFSKSQFDRINKFVEAHSYHFTPLDSLHDNITDTDDDSDLAADVDPDTLIRIVRTELKNGKASGIDNVYNIILKKAIGTGFYKVLAPAFTISLKLYFIPHVWEVAVVCMLIKPDKPPSQTTSYRSISLLNAIMKLFERVIEKRLLKHLEDNGFFSKCQSGFRKSKSTNDHFFVSLRPSWKASIGENM